MGRAEARTPSSPRRPEGFGLAREPLVLTGLADEIAFRVEAAILEGVYPPGSRLPQDELCERFGVSRTPVREAIRQLQARHLVVVIPNKGATVRIPTRKELMDVYDVRSEIEGYASELAAERIPQEGISELDRAQERLVDLVARLEQDRSGGSESEGLHMQLKRANDDFHRIIHQAAGNDHLLQLAQNLGRLFPKDYVWRASRDSNEMRILSVEEHGRMRAALAAADKETARREMREHILHARTVLLRYLDSLDFWS
jgi:DNA-binding GntR family transcriptional regulator